MIQPGAQFTWKGEPLTYLDHPYNSTLLNERAIEVPIAQRWLADRAGDGVEVGNVLGHYLPVNHRVVDLYEDAPGVEQVDVFDLTGPADWVLAISTLEHVRWDYDEVRDPEGAAAACRHLVSLLAPGGAMLVTVPIGQNPCLDAAIMDGHLHASVETTALYDETGWTFTSERVWRPLRERHWPGAVWIGEWFT